MLELRDRPRIIAIVADEVGMEMILVSAKPEDKKRIIEAKILFEDRHRPTYLDFEYGITVKETPDGDLTRHIVIWHARWTMEKDLLPCST